MAIRCCKDCVAPKRYPGCHGTCPDYLKEKAEHDAMKAEDFERRKTRNELLEQRNTVVYKAFKRRRRS